MTALEVAQRLNARKTGRNRWMARCPSHPDRKPSLSITEGSRCVLLKCWSRGCEVRDIVKAAGLTMEQLAYDSGRRVDSKVWAETQRKREAEEKRAGELRVGTWIIRFATHGYTAADRAEDMTVIAACAIVLSNPEEAKAKGVSIPDWEAIFQVHMERIAASDYCRKRRMLPATKKEGAK